MRGLVASALCTALVLMALVATGVARASEEACEVETGSEASGLTTDVIIEGGCVRGQRATSDFAEVREPPAVETSSGLDDDTEPEPVWALEPVFATHPDTGEPCLDLLVSSTVTVNDNVGLAWEARMLEMLNDPRLGDVQNRWCTPELAPVDDPSPDVHRFLHTITLPTPQLHIAPGYAVTGMPAYLEITGQDSYEISESLPGFGTLTARLSATRFDVDWGDGTTERVDDGRTGAPYDGPAEQQILHEYLHPDDDLTVTVTARWVASWELGAFSGTVADLESTAAFDLPVRTLVSVRAADE